MCCGSKGLCLWLLEFKEVHCYARKYGWQLTYFPALRTYCIDSNNITIFSNGKIKTISDLNVF
jgi:hypothetical protein